MDSDVVPAAVYGRQLPALRCSLWDILAQKYTIVLDFKDTPVEAVLDAITKQTGIKIAYNNEVLDRKKPVTVKIETSDILEALYAVLGDSYICRQIDDYIAVSKRPKPVSARLPVNRQR